MRHALLLIATMVSAEMVLDDHPYCAIRYRRLCQGKGRHVACQFPVPGPGEYCRNYTRIKFTREMKGFITTYINRRRQRLAAGNERVRGGALVPRPQLMMQVVYWNLPFRYLDKQDWDRELAMLAQRLADQCTFVHDDCRATVRYPYAGQTVGEVRWRRSSDSDELSAQRAVRRVLDAWWGERRRVHPKEIIAPFRITPKGMSWGHFSQLAVWTLRAVGCAAVRHDDPPRLLLVCDFSHTNMLGQRTLTPGPLAPCPVHSIRKPRSAFPLLCAAIRYKNVPTDYVFETYDQDYEDETKQDDIVELLDEEPGTFLETEKAKFKLTQEKPRKTTAEPKIKIEVTTQKRKNKVLRPSAEETEVRPSEEYNKRRPNEEYNKVRPNDEYEKAMPNEEYSKLTRYEEHSKVRPSDENSKVRPNKEFNQVRPSDENSNERPKEEYSNVRSNAEFSRVKPNKELKQGVKERIRGNQRTTRKTNDVPFQYRSTFLFHDDAVSSTKRRLLPMLTSSHRTVDRLESLEEHPQKRLQDSRLRPAIASHPVYPEPPNEELKSQRNEEYETLNSLKKSQGVQKNMTPLRVRWQQSRERPSRPGAKALLTSRRPIVINQRPAEKASVKISLKMDKEDQEQLFRDTGFKLKYNHR